MDLNKAMIIGRLTQDPEIRTTPAGATVTSFGVATNLIWTDQSGQRQERVEFHNVVVWRRLAEIAGQYLKKGSKAYFEGRLQTRNWMGQDNVRRYRTEIIVDNLIMLDRPGAPASSTGAEQPPTPSEEPVIDVEEATSTDETNPSEEEIKVENIPF